jgi:hypothetical protein
MNSKNQPQVPSPQSPAYPEGKEGDDKKVLDFLNARNVVQHPNIHKVAGES